MIFLKKHTVMGYFDIDGYVGMLGLSDELVPHYFSTYYTREELEDEKKELAGYRNKRREFIDALEREKRERDERIPAEELQQMMLPLEIINRRIKELEYQIANAQIIEKSSKVQPDEIEEVLDADDEIDVVDSGEKVPEAMFFVRDGVEVEAKTGTHTPFYALVNQEYIGFNRLKLDGWTLVDDTGREIADISEAWNIRNAICKKERAEFMQSLKEKYPNVFMPWTDEENERLLDLYSNQNKTVAELSEILGRTRNGISLQLRKLLEVDRLPIRRKPVDVDQYSLNPISITSINPESIPDNQMPDYLNLIEQMEKWFKSVKEYAAQQAVENGVCYDGYEVKTTLKTSFTDTKRAMETISERFPELFNSCVQLKSSSFVKKILGEENYNSSVAEFVEQKEQNTLVKAK